MTTHGREPAELAALRAEREQLNTVTEVLSDMVNAACDASERKGHRDCAAEDSKIGYWKAVHKPALAEYFAATDAYCEEKYGSESVEQIRAQRDQVYRRDPEMLALVAKARADLAERRQARTPVERDRRRSR